VGQQQLNCDAGAAHNRQAGKEWMSGPDSDFYKFRTEGFLVFDGAVTIAA